MQLTLELLPSLLAVCKTDATAMPPQSIWHSPFFALVRTPEELSLVIDVDLAPEGWDIEPDWCAFKVAGPLDFSLTGVLDALSHPLAVAGVSIFAISTYDTDYLLVKRAMLARAGEVLTTAGHRIED